MRSPLLRLVLPPPTPVPPSFSTCGDGLVDPGETCDDTNQVDGDGCSSDCTIEPNYVCPPEGAPCTRIEICGDAILQSTEACDDGNVTSGDGCSPSCQLEVGFRCPVPGRACTSVAQCGDGNLMDPEQCEPAGIPGCSAICQVEPGWVCPPGWPCFTRCGDGITAGLEQCDDGNAGLGDGCDTTCALEWDYCLRSHACPNVYASCGNAIVEFGEACDSGGPSETCGDNCQLRPQCDANGYCDDICGDGIAAGSNCDDGNLRNGDGCNSQCELELDFDCSLELTPLLVPSGVYTRAEDAGVLGEPTELQTVYVELTRCRPVCGNGLLQLGEQCDPSSINESEATCTVDCRRVSSYCGDGVASGTEQCDDGQNLGLSPGDCQPGCEHQRYCGDAIVDPTLGELCDLGKENNVGAYGTCTSFCTLAARCGDGLVQACGGEQCDDGNYSGGDGCSAACRTEDNRLLIER